MTAIRVRATWTLPAPSAVLTARQLLTREEITRGLSCSEKNRDYCTAIQPDWGARATCSSAASASRSRRRSASSVSCSAATCARGRARCALSEPACKIAAKTQADTVRARRGHAGSPDPPNFVSAPVFTFALSTAADTAHDGGRPRRWVPSFSFFFCLFYLVHGPPGP